MPIQGGVAHISHTAQIEVRAPAEAAFAVIAEDLQPDEPLQVGFRWEETVVLDRSLCRTAWIVTELRAPWVLEQLMGHLCLGSSAELSGGERWQLDETGDGSTIVSLRSWRMREGLRGRLERLFASPADATGISLRQRLAEVRLRAEQGAPRPV